MDKDEKDEEEWAVRVKLKLGRRRVRAKMRSIFIFEHYALYFLCIFSPDRQT